MTRVEFLLGIPVILTVLYPVVMRVLAEAIQPTRLAMADMERALLSSETLSLGHKKAVRVSMDSAMDAWTLPGFAIAIPRIAFGRHLRREMLDVGLPADSDGRLFIRFMGLTLASACVANPFFAFIVACEALVLMPVEAYARSLSSTKVLPTGLPFASESQKLDRLRVEADRSPRLWTLRALSNLAISIRLVDYSHG